MKNYMQSKVGNVFLAKESARRLDQAGIFNVVGPEELYEYSKNGLMEFRASILVC